MWQFLEFSGVFSTSTGRWRRAGFTLLELLVAVAIIGILIALLLPAVISAREAARRNQCANNLRQIGIALRNYESAHFVLPPGVVNAAGPIRNRPEEYHIGWIPQILPYLEEPNTYRHIDFSVGAYDKKNAAVRELQLDLLSCPSEDHWDKGSVSYAGCHHDVEAPIDAKDHGVFFLNSAVRSKKIPDGLAHTIFVGEKRLDARETTWLSGTMATLRNTGTLPNKTGVDANWGTYWVRAVNGRNYGTMFWTAEPTEQALGAPEDEFQPAETSDEGWQWIVGGFGSAHRGVTNLLFGDGSVHAIADTIAGDVYRQLGHRSDGKLLKERPF